MLEIERKYLLKRLPIEPAEDVLDIRQYYMEVDGVMVRYRKVIYQDKTFDFIKTIKTPVDEMTYEEDENHVLPNEFEDFVENCNQADVSYFIHKKRHIYINGVDKWEVDQYMDFDLVIAELEMPTKEHEFETPEHISDELIMEVTGLREFTNLSLAEKINS
jgi:CYTH domain-containing protein